MRLPQTLLVLGACACLLLALPAAAQWGWKEKNGSRIFSDQAPPAGVADKDIFKRPAGSRAAPAAPAAAADTTSATALAAPDDAVSVPKPVASALKLPGKDTGLEKKKKEAEAAEAAKKKAAEQDTAKARAENCERAKKGVATFDTGVRVATTNDKGEREIMSDTQRATESKRLQGIVAQDCK